MKRIFTIILLVLTVAAGYCSAPDDKAAAKQQQLANLKKTNTPLDSIYIYCNLFDLESDRTKATAYGMKLIDVAQRIGDDADAFDMIRNLSSRNMRSDSLQEVLMKRVLTFRRTGDRIQTETFIRLVRNQTKLHYSKDVDKVKALEEQLKNSQREGNGDIYDRLVTLHAITVTLSDYPEDDISLSYVDQLNRLVDQLPESDYALRNLFYVNAALAYTRTGLAQKALEYDRKLLKIIDDLDERNKRIHRDFRSYDGTRYVVYTRMLENYKALNDREAREYYAKTRELVSKDVRAASNDRIAPLPDIFFAMHQKDYAKALNLLEKYIDSDADIVKHKKLRLLSMLIEAARATGNQAALNNAYPKYIELLDSYINSRVHEKYRILQAVYRVNEVRDENSRLIQEHQQEIKSRWRLVSILCGVIALILLTALVLTYRMERKARKLADDLATTNGKLEEEQQHLIETRSQLMMARDAAERANDMKSDFINNMSHEVKAPLQALREYSNFIAESTDDSKKKYIQHFADLLLLNSELVETIVNDVLQISKIHNSEVKVHREPLYVSPICESAIDTVKHRVNENVRILFKPGDKDQMVFTDRHRLMQILINLLQNAAKFTQSGTITIGYKANRNNKSVDIFVEDTGIGIAAKHAEHIFDRFVKLDPNTQGVGLGLAISRSLARLMSGELKLDTTYTGGARFVVTLPVE